jgi:hypothetical protein
MLSMMCQEICNSSICYLWCVKRYVIVVYVIYDVSEICNSSICYLWCVKRYVIVVYVTYDVSRDM